MGLCHYCGTPRDDRHYCATCQRLVAVPPAERVGTVEGNYKLERFVGQGPIGAVYEAVNVASGARARLKLIDSELVLTDPDLAQAAVELALGVAGLHEGLPELIEAGIDNSGSPVLPTPWCEGEPLSKKLQAGPLQASEACAITTGVLQALGAMHEAELAHLDVKPANVLLVPGGDGVKVRLLDVGTSAISSRAQSGAYYRSPEQARGAEVKGPLTDIYSCGAMLYEMLSGQRPFQATDADVLISKIALREPQPLIDVAPAVDPRLAAVVAKAMSRKPEERCRTAREMVDEIQAVAAVLQGPAGPPQAEPTQPPAQGGTQPQVVTPPRPSAVPRPSVPAQVAAAPTTATTADLAAAEPGPSGSRRLKLVGLGLMLAAVVACLVLYVAWVGRERARGTSTQRAPDAASVQPPAPGYRRVGTVSIRLEGLPVGAAWMVDGRRLAANPFRAPRDTRTHTIRVEAPGHEPFETTISFAEDRIVPVQLAPIEAVPVLPFKAPAGKGRPFNPRLHKGTTKGPVPPPVDTIHQPDLAPAQLRDRQSVSPGKSVP